jgi:hypothetical protein
MSYRTFWGRLWGRYLSVLTPAGFRLKRKLDKECPPKKPDANPDPSIPALLPYTRMEKLVNHFYWLFFAEFDHVRSHPNEAMKKQWEEEDKIKQAKREEALRIFGPEPVQPLVASTFLGKCKFMAKYAWMYAHSRTVRFYYKEYGIPWGRYDWRMVRALDLLARKARRNPDKESKFGTYKSLKIIRLMLDRKHHIRQRAIWDADGRGYTSPPTTWREDCTAYWRVFSDVLRTYNIDRNFGFGPMPEPKKNDDEVTHT